MLIPAQLRKEELQRKLVETWYDPKYMYYYDGPGKYENVIPDNCEYQRHFASIGKDGNILGYISYTYDDLSGSAKWFGIMCFEDKYCYEFLVDCIRVIDDIFYKFNLHRVNFCCFAENPVLYSYRRFIKRYGGKEVCRFRETARLMDGYLHDSIHFEILEDDLIWNDEETTSQLHVDRLRMDKMLNSEEMKNDTI